ncbi:MAG: hypothetical protein Q7S55_02720 [Nanoarchaeota archaeon]|nr:hypothetical protein [Nanoarchaeota archaeon]
MTKHFIGDLRRQQSALAEPIAKTLFHEVKPYLANGKYDALKAYVGWADELHSADGVDESALEALVESEIGRDVLGAVMTYTDLVASRIVLQGDYSVPSPTEIDFPALQRKAGIKNSEIVKRVISHMHAQTKLPLLGKIEAGYFKPDHSVFETWKSFYDWKK